jgi:S-(hydroxymethyl)glutathione dehydrogenase/alcohol dehydrogenase
MKAAILQEIDAPLKVVDATLPDLTFGQVLVRVSCAGICGAQLQEISGQKGDKSHLPHLLGHEGCGMVEGIGPGVSHVAVGDKVVIHWRKGAGLESPLPVYQAEIRGAIMPQTIKSGPVTCFSEFAVISENRVTKIPSDVPDELAALFGCCLSTALSVVEREARCAFGERVLVIGCGGLGLACILAARLANPSFISAVDVTDAKLDMAIDVGADDFNVFTPDFMIDDFDVVIDTTGSASMMSWLAPSGRYIMVGQPKRGITIENAAQLFEGEGKTIKATQGGGFQPARDLPRYVALWRSGALWNYDKLITHRVDIYDINRGIDLVRDGKAGRVMVRMAINAERDARPNYQNNGSVELPVLTSGV